MYLGEILKFRDVDLTKFSPDLFTLKDIQGDFEKVLSSWFQLYEDHSIVQYLSFGRLSSSYAEDRFLNLARALEVYHRVKDPGTVMPPAEFRKRRQEALSAANEEDKTFFKSRLQENIANRYTFKERLHRLLSILKSLNLPETLGVTNENLGNRIGSIRDELTHYSKKKPVSKEKAESISPEEIFYLYGVAQRSYPRTTSH